MTTWGNICRVCSSPAEYLIFATIPPYLHESTNEYLQWQKPINILLEEATGLKVSTNDGLPEKICALCISYLKHAVTFREQAICNTMNLKALQLLHENFEKSETEEEKQLRLEEKQSFLINADDLSYAEGHQIDLNLLTNNCKQIQDKVCKELLRHITSGTVKAEDISEQVRCLTLGKDKNSSHASKSRNFLSNANKKFDSLCGEEDTGSESDDDSKSEPSSDGNMEEVVEEEEESATAMQNQNIFSYKEKIFEEDDIMDSEELRNIVSYNVSEPFKERKCPACSRRFMFTESYNAHTDLCFEYAFLIFIEDVNRLLKVRRKKAVSPHEFIRRMIFRFRKMCEWLKQNSDEALPDIMEVGEKEPSNICAKCSESLSVGVAAKQNDELGLFETFHEQKTSTNDFLDPLPINNILLDFPSEQDLNLDLFAMPKPSNCRLGTPINMSNNILYEIEQSLSRNSSTTTTLDISPNKQLKKPIPILGTSTVLAPTEDEDSLHQGNCKSNEDNMERLTFLQKLQKACQTPPCQMQEAASPQISVRKDLMLNVETEPEQVPKELPRTPMALKFVARCNACGILFQSLAALEVHNAAHHNNQSQQ